MALGANLQYLRKKYDMTQESLAERMEVSRQTVSKWESDGAFPEMDKIIALCDLFDVRMDDLLRQDLAAMHASSTVRDETGHIGYDRFMNRFTYQICAGVALVLFGVAMILLLRGIFGGGVLGVMVFFLLLTVAVGLFIIAGLDYARFVERHPVIDWRYPPERIEAFERIFPSLIVAPIVLILLGIVWLVGSTAIPTPEGMARLSFDLLAVGIFLLDIALSVPIFVYAGIQKMKYDLNAYNASHAVSAAEAGEGQPRKPHDSISDRISSAIMILAVIIFLYVGFVHGIWHPTWVVFPIGGLLCGLISVLFPNL